MNTKFQIIIAFIIGLTISYFINPIIVKDCFTYVDELDQKMNSSTESCEMDANLIGIYVGLSIK